MERQASGSALAIKRFSSVSISRMGEEAKPRRNVCAPHFLLDLNLSVCTRLIQNHLSLNVINQLTKKLSKLTISLFNFGSNKRKMVRNKLFRVSDFFPRVKLRIFFIITWVGSRSTFRCGSPRRLLIYKPTQGTQGFIIYAPPGDRKVATLAKFWPVGTSVFRFPL